MWECLYGVHYGGRIGRIKEGGDILVGWQRVGSSHTHLLIIYHYPIYIFCMSSTGGCLKKIKITTYHFKEEADNRSNDSKNDLSSRQENNDDEVDAITIRKYYEK